MELFTVKASQFGETEIVSESAKGAAVKGVEQLLSGNPHQRHLALNMVTVIDENGDEHYFERVSEWKEVES